MVLIKEIDSTTNKGTTYVEMSTEKREALVSYCPGHFYPIAIYTTKHLSAGRTFKTWEEAISGYKNRNIIEMIETAKMALEIDTTVDAACDEIDTLVDSLASQQLRDQLN